MALDADLMADRRRLRRKLSFWRVLTFLVLIAAVVAGGFWSARGRIAGVGNQIARVSVTGFIAGDERMAALLKRIGSSAEVKGVVVSINSPGGTTSGSEEIFRNLRDLAAKKPTVAFVDGLAASGAYITALGTDHIVSRETALVGSIGVLFQYPDVSKLLTRVGVSLEEIKSSPLKAEPSGTHTPPPEAVAALQAVVNDTYDWFKGLVRDRRGMNAEQLAAVSDGRVFSARQGVPLKLVDQLGTERDAVAWLEDARGVAKDLPVRDWKPRSGSDFSLWTSAAFGADLLGLDGVASLLRAASVHAAKLDGLLVVWQPALSDR